MNKFDEFVAAVETATGKPGRRIGKNIRLLCPAHDDHDPSLDVAEGEDGRPLVVCRSHDCSFEDVCRAVGREPRHFFPLRNESVEDCAPHRPSTTTYDYVDEQGQLLFQVCRKAGKRFSQRRPDGNGGWVYNLEGVRRVLYRLPEVLAAKAGVETIYICEGEKDVDALRRAGAVATCNPGGVGKWRGEYAAILRGAKVVIVADNDEAGLAHAQAVAASLSAQGNGSATAVSIVRAKEGKDAYDHLAAGFGLDDFVPVEAASNAELERRLVWAWGPDFVSKEEDVQPPLVGRKGDELVPYAGLAMVGGSGGAGKSTLSLHALGHFASGTAWFGVQVLRPLRIGIIENEGPRQPFREKVQAFAEAWNGADFLANCAFLESPWGRFSFADEGLRGELRDFIVENSIDLLVAGPLGRLGIQGVGSPEETRQFLALLADVGVQQDVAMWLVHHVNKARHPSIVDALSGDWGGHPDTILGVEHDGGRRTKVTFGKVRWGDQGRAPLLLEWLPAEEGLGYRVIEAVDAASVGAANRERVFDAIQAGHHEARAVAELLELEKRTVSNHFNALVEAGRITLREGQNRSKLAFPLSPEGTVSPEEGFPTQELSWH